jgi:hypothetical protein
VLAALLLSVLPLALSLGVFMFVLSLGVLGSH